MSLTKFKKITKSLVSCVLGSSLLLGVGVANKPAMAIFTDEFVQQKQKQYKDCPFILKVLNQLLQINGKVDFRPFYPTHIFGSRDNAVYELHLSIKEYENWKNKYVDKYDPTGAYSKYIVFGCIKNVITYIFASAFDKYETFNETSKFTDLKTLEEISSLECPIDRGLAFINYVFESKIIEDSEENEKYFLNYILEWALEDLGC